MLKDCAALKTLTVNKTAGEMAPNACSGVGTKTSPCELIYPSGFTPEKTATGSGWFQWKSGYFKDASGYHYAMGDVNHDKSVGIADVMLTVDYVLGNTPPVFFVNEADVSGDGEITVADVTSIVNITLNGVVYSEMKGAFSSLSLSCSKSS